MSKLYTEEEVRKLLNEILVLSSSVDDAIGSLTPIELPSIEEVDNASLFISSERMQFIKGAIWMRDKIKGGNND